MVKCSPTSSGTSSHQRSTLPTSRAGARSVCRTQAASRPASAHLPGRYQPPSLHEDPDPGSPIRLCAVGRFLNPRPALLDPPVDGGLVTFDGATLGPLHTPAQPMP